MKYVAVWAFMLVAGPAVGQSFPNFSIEKHCEAAGGGFDYCVQRTQEIYSRLREHWESVPPDVRGRCLRWLRTSAKPDSYYQLEECVLGPVEASPPVYYGDVPPPPPTFGFYFRR